MGRRTGAFWLVACVLVAVGVLLFRGCESAPRSATAPLRVGAASRPQGPPPRGSRAVNEAMPPPPSDAPAPVQAADGAAAAPSESGARLRLLKIRVLEPSGAPAAGAAVFVTDQFDGDGGSRARLAEGTTGEDGRVEFRVPPTNCVLHAARRGEAASLGNVGNWAGDGDASRDVELRLGPVLVVRGFVRLSDGTRVAGAEVTGAFERAISHWACVLRTTSGPDGRFAFEAVPRDQYVRPATLTVARAPGRWSSEARVRPDVAETDDVELVVEPTCALRGRCVDARGAAAARVYVQFYGARWNTGGRSDESGRFAFEVPRGAGFVELHEGARRTRVEDVRAVADELDLGEVRIPDADARSER